MIEVERRYKVSSPQAMLATLAAHAVTLLEEQHVIDQWYIPDTIHNQADHDVWFDENRGLACRLRRVFLPDGAVQAVLDSKQHTDANNHNTFKEEVIMRGDEAAMERWLQDRRYYNWLTIDKLRRRFHSPTAGLSIVMDTVEGVKEALGFDTALELEYEGEGTRDEALAAIDDFAKTLGLTAGDLFEKSITVESMRVLARFR
jgi:adenylate cyclase class IV